MALKKKILVIVGPTASGKTALALQCAEHFNGEIISADSRQVYRTLDVGTEKITQTQMNGVPHHLIDIRDPEEIYTAADFRNDADNAISNITERGKLPVVVGGTFFYIDALLGRTSLPNIPPNSALRAELEKMSTKELVAMLEKKDPHRASTIDKDNRRRLIRALEIIDARGFVPPPEPSESPYDTLIIGIDVPKEELRERIHSRLKETLAKGLIEETEKLLEAGISRERLNEIGLEYRIVIKHLDGELPEEKLLETLEQKVWQYAKRQRLWLKDREDIKWFGREVRHTGSMSQDLASYFVLK